MDPGETDLDAAYRETKEEAGISRDSLTLLDFTHTLKYKVCGRPKTVIYWLAESSTEEVVLSEESQAYRWAELEEAYGGPFVSKLSIQKCCLCAYKSRLYRLDGQQNRFDLYHV